MVINIANTSSFERIDDETNILKCILKVIRKIVEEIWISLQSKDAGVVGKYPNPGTNYPV